MAREVRRAAALPLSRHVPTPPYAAVQIFIAILVIALSSSGVTCDSDSDYDHEAGDLSKWNDAADECAFYYKGVRCYESPKLRNYCKFVEEYIQDTNCTFDDVSAKTFSFDRSIDITDCNYKTCFNGTTCYISKNGAWKCKTNETRYCVKDDCSTIDSSFDIDSVPSDLDDFVFMMDFYYPITLLAWGAHSIPTGIYYTTNTIEESTWDMLYKVSPKKFIVWMTHKGTFACFIKEGCVFLHP